MMQVLGGVVGGVAQGLGYSPMLAAQIEGMVLLNLHVFLPGIEKVDKAITKKFYNSEEAILKSEQDWFFINQKANQLFDYVSLSNKFLQGNLTSDKEEVKIDSHLGAGPGDVPHLHYDPVTKAVRDINKVGPPGSSAKLETGETKTNPGDELRNIIKKMELQELPKQSDESKRIVE